MNLLCNLARGVDEDARKYAYRVLYLNIRNLYLKPGEKLSEHYVSKSIHVSRTPVHDTFMQLSREHLLIVEPRRGTFIAPISVNRVEECIWLCKKTTIGVLERIYRLNLKPTQLERIVDLVSSCQDAFEKADLSLLADLDKELFLALYELIDCALLFQTVWSNCTDLYRLCFVEPSMDFWAQQLSSYQLLLKGLKEHHFEVTQQAVTSYFDSFQTLLHVMPEKYPVFLSA